MVHTSCSGTIVYYYKFRYHLPYRTTRKTNKNSVHRFQTTNPKRKEPRTTHLITVTKGTDPNHANNWEGSSYSNECWLCILEKYKTCHYYYCPQQQHSYRQNFQRRWWVLIQFLDARGV